MSLGDFPVGPGGTDARPKPVKSCPSHQDACSRGVQSARGAGRGHATGRERDACSREERCLGRVLAYVRRRSGTHEGWAVWARAEVRGNACVSAGKAAEGVPGATTKKVVLVCPYASCLGFSGRSQRKPTLGDAGSVQASRGDVRSARSGEGGQGRMHGEAVTCHLSKEPCQSLGRPDSYDPGACPRHDGSSQK